MNTHINFESVLLLFTQHYQNKSVVVETKLQLSKVGTFLRHSV